MHESLKTLAALLLRFETVAAFSPAGSRPAGAHLDPHSVRSDARQVMQKAPQPQSIELTYFDIKATPGEKVRLALALSETPFKDNRVKFPDWAELKPKTKYGQLPILNVDGVEHYQSGAMLRWAGTLGDGSLYPVGDSEKLLKIEDMLGVSDDLQRAWTPSLYMGMGDAHKNFGHPEEWPEKEATVKQMRETFLEKELPKFMGFLSNELEQTGAFLTGEKPTIADCQMLPQVASFTKGFINHVPTDCLKDFPLVVAWIDRMMALPSIQKFNEQQAS